MPDLNRRSFLAQAATFASAVAVLKRDLLAADSSLFDRMTWFNQPASFQKEGGKLIVHSRPKTDFWRKTYYGYITDNGHFFHLKAAGDFTGSPRQRKICCPL